MENSHEKILTEIQAIDEALETTVTITPKGGPNLIFIAPTPENGTEVAPPITLNAVGNALSVEFWLNGELMGSDDSMPFSIFISDDIELGTFSLDVYIVGGANYFEDYSIDWVFVNY